jgi:KaiC/GvpD/RAD55 family RecA-like ATPase
MEEEASLSFTEDFDNLPPGWIVLLETSAEKALEISLSAIRYLLDEKNYIGIVVSASRPYKNIVQLYQQKNIDTKKIIIIDCISKSQSIDLQEAGNVLYLDAVSDLTSISLAIKGCMDKIEGNKFVFVDSITSMLIHNEPSVFARFIHGMLTKMRISGTSGLLISLEKETESDIRAEIAQLCDKIVRL